MDVGREWPRGIGRTATTDSTAVDEATAVLSVADRLSEVMVAIHASESPAAARRVLRDRFGLSRREATLLLTTPVLAFTRSERGILEATRASRLEFLCEQTGMLPAVTAAPPVAAVPPVAVVDEISRAPSAPAPARPPAPEIRPLVAAPPAAELAGPAGVRVESLVHEIDDALRELDLAVGLGGPVGAAPRSGPPLRRVTPSAPAYLTLADEPEYRRRLDPSAGPGGVLDEQISELCSAIAGTVGARARTPAGRLEISGVDDEVGTLTFLRHMHDTGLDAVPRLLPFIDPVPAADARPLSRILASAAAEARTLGEVPRDGGTWSRGLLPVAHRRGHGYAVLHSDVPDRGSVWAFDGVDPVERLWDSLVDMLGELYSALTTGRALDGAVVRAYGGGAVEWLDLG